MVVTSQTYLPTNNTDGFPEAKVDNVSDLLNIENGKYLMKTAMDTTQNDANANLEKKTNHSVALNGTCNGNEPQGGTCQDAAAEEEGSQNTRHHSSSLAESQTAKSREDEVQLEDTGMQMVAKSSDSESDTEDSSSNPDEEDDDGEGVPQDIPEAPEGGWGWAVVLGTFVVYWLIPGMIRSYGAIYLEIMETFPDCTAAEAGWIPALLSSISVGLAPISAVLGKLYSCRNVVFVGGLFCAAGLSLSYFATSIFYLYISFGLIAGIGAGLCTTPSVIVINSYFVKKRALASGMCLCGAAFGSFTLPMFVGYLVRQYRFRGTMLIMGAVILHVSASALLYTKDGKWFTKGSKKPKKSRTDSKTIQSNGIKLPQLNGGNRTNSFIIRPSDAIIEEKVRTRSLLVQDKLQTELLLGDKLKTQSLLGDKSLLGSKIIEGKEQWPPSPRLRPLVRSPSRTSSFTSSVRHLQLMSTSINHSLNDISTASVYFENAHDSSSNDGSSDNVGEAGERKPKKSMCAKVLKQVMTFIRLCLDFSLFKEAAYCITVIAGSCVAGGFPHVLFFAPAFAQTMGCSKMDAAVLLSICSGVDLVGRISYGWFMDQQIISRSRGLFISLAACAIGTLCIPLSTSYGLLAFFTALYGFGSGTSFMLLPVILADNHGVEKLPSTYGLMRLFQGCVTLMIPPIAGLLKDTTGVYHYCFVFMGLILLGGAIAMLFMPCAQRRDAKRVQMEKSPI